MKGIERAYQREKAVSESKKALINKVINIPTNAEIYNEEIVYSDENRMGLGDYLIYQWKKSNGNPDNFTNDIGIQIRRDSIEKVLTDIVTSFWKKAFREILVIWKHYILDDRELMKIINKLFSDDIKLKNDKLENWESIVKIMDKISDPNPYSICGPDNDLTKSAISLMDKLAKHIDFLLRTTGSFRYGSTEPVPHSSGKYPGDPSEAEWDAIYNRNAPYMDWNHPWKETIKDLTLARTNMKDSDDQHQAYKFTGLQGKYFYVWSIFRKLYTEVVQYSKSNSQTIRYGMGMIRTEKPVSRENPMDEIDSKARLAADMAIGKDPYSYFYSNIEFPDRELKFPVTPDVSPVLNEIGKIKSYLEMNTKKISELREELSPFFKKVYQYGQDQLRENKEKKKFQIVDRLSGVERYLMELYELTINNYKPLNEVIATVLPIDINSRMDAADTYPQKYKVEGDCEEIRRFCVNPENRLDIEDFLSSVNDDYWKSYTQFYNKSPNEPENTISKLKELSSIYNETVNQFLKLMEDCRTVFYKREEIATEVLNSKNLSIFDKDEYHPLLSAVYDEAEKIKDSDAEEDETPVAKHTKEKTLARLENLLNSVETVKPDDIRYDYVYYFEKTKIDSFKKVERENIERKRSYDLEKQFHIEKQKLLENPPDDPSERREMEDFWGSFDDWLDNKTFFQNLNPKDIEDQIQAIDDELEQLKLSRERFSVIEYLNFINSPGANLQNRDDENNSRTSMAAKIRKIRFLYYFVLNNFDKIKNTKLPDFEGKKKDEVRSDLVGEYDEYMKDLDKETLLDTIKSYFAGKRPVNPKIKAYLDKEIIALDGEIKAKEAAKDNLKRRLITVKDFASTPEIVTLDKSTWQDIVSKMQKKARYILTRYIDGHYTKVG